MVGLVTLRDRSVRVDPGTTGDGGQTEAPTGRDTNPRVVAASRDEAAPAPRRPDIEGLRGVAIALVVLYHAGLPVTGGFVGVDVFLVISGFLITGLLLRELERTGSISLSAFYGRRVRRLVPAAAVALTATMLWSAAALSPLDQPQAMADAGAAALSVANLRFAAQGLDYFNLGRVPSPVLHYWSLSVEEQFYVVWPALLLAVAWFARRLHGQRVRLAGGIALAVIAASGLAASIVLTAAAPTWGFYSLPARAWEFALGGLIAVGASAVERIPRRVAVAIGWLSAILLIAAAVTLDDSVPYPGTAALLPTAAAAGLIIAGGRGGIDLVLGTAPLQFLGRISYSLYLWHWPFIVLPAAMAGAALDLPTTLALIGLAVVVAWLSRRFIELPFLAIDGRRPGVVGASLKLGAATLALVLAVSGGLQILASAEVANAGEAVPISAAANPGGGQTTAPGVEASVPPADEAQRNAQASEDAGPVVDGSAPPAAADPGPSGAAATNPGPSATPQAPTSTAPQPLPPPLVRWTDIGSAALPANVPLPAGVRPSLAGARTDEERLIADGCFSGLDATTPAHCVYGARNGRVTVALIGDSHASHWFPALNVLANLNGWRLLPFVKASCPFLATPVFHPFVQRPYTECETWRARAIAAVNAAQPDLVIVAEAYDAANLPIDPNSRSLAARGRAMAAAISQLRAQRVAIMIDNPRTDVDIPACLARYPNDVNRCAIPRSVAFPPNFGVVERVAADASGARVIDIVAAVCPSTPCPVVRGGMILYRDGHHLTETFSRSLAGPLGAAIEPLLAAPAGTMSPSPDSTGPPQPSGAAALSPTADQSAPRPTWQPSPSAPQTGHGSARAMPV